MLVEFLATKRKSIANYISADVEAKNISLKLAPSTPQHRKREIVITFT